MFPSNESSSFPSVTEEERRRLIDQLYEETWPDYMPAMVFLGLIAFVGIIGNTMVLMVYSKKMRSKKYPSDSTDIFIMAIAIFDLLTNVLLIPANIWYCLTRYDVDSGVICQLGFYFSGITTMSSLGLLLGIAVTRYKMTCVPFGKQITKRTAMMVCIGIPFASAIVQIPSFFVYTFARYATGVPGVYTLQCGYNDDDEQRVWSLLFFAFWGLLAILILGSMITLYVCICIEAWRLSKRLGVLMTANTSTNSKAALTEFKDSDGTQNNNSLVSRGLHGAGADYEMEDKTNKDTDDDNHTLKARGMHGENSTESKDCVTDPEDISSTWQEGDGSTHCSTPTEPSSQNRVFIGVTLMMAAISAVFVISTVPILVGLICEMTIPGFYDDITTGGRQAYHIVMRIFFINSAANAIIYGLCNGNFREEVVVIFCCRRGQQNSIKNGHSYRLIKRVTNKNKLQTVTIS